MVVALDTGFDRQDLTDPVIVADVNSTGVLDGLDASYVAQKSVLPASRPEIPDRPAGAVAAIPPGIDPALSIALNIPAAAGGTVVVPINVDDATGLYGFNVNVDYDTTSSQSRQRTWGVRMLRWGAYFSTPGWTLVSGVDDATGHVAVSLYRDDALGRRLGRRRRTHVPRLAGSS